VDSLKEVAGLLNRLLRDRGVDNPQVFADPTDLYIDFTYLGENTLLHAEIDGPVFEYFNGVTSVLTVQHREQGLALALKIIEDIEAIADFKFTRAMTSSKYHDGKSITVAISVPANIAGGLEEPHVTVLYVGDLPKENTGTLLNAIGAVFNGQPALTATLDSVVTYFEPTTNSEGRRVAKLAVTVPGLESLHKKLWGILEEEGVAVSHSFDEFKPHLTLAYIEPGTEFTGTVPQGSWVIDSVEVWGWDEHVEIPFSSTVLNTSNQSN
jgi:2'-5' RNA ligase